MSALPNRFARREVAGRIRAVSSMRMRHIAHALSLFAGAISTRANVAGAARPGLRHSWRTRLSKHEGERVSVRIISDEQGEPAGKFADAEMAFEAYAGPLSGLTSIGFAVWKRRDGGKA